jgi:sec-independent protein translocase protein TatA
MFGISGEHLLILGVVLLFFGPRRLPELGNTLGKAIRNFKDAISGVEEAQYRKIEDPAKGPAPMAAAQPAQTPVAETVSASAKSDSHT